MNFSKNIKTIDKTIDENKAHRQTTKISTSSSSVNIDKYKIFYKGKDYYQKLLQ